MPHDANREMFLTNLFIYDKLHKSCKFLIKKRERERKNAHLGRDSKADSSYLSLSRIAG